MAILLFLLAVAGAVLVGDLVLENTASGSVTVLDRSFSGYTQASCWPRSPRSGSWSARWRWRR